MKRLFYLVFFMICYSSAFSQFIERLYGQVGGTLGADIMLSEGSIRQESFETTNINYATVFFSGRMNILEFSNDLALSLAGQPTLSVGRAYNEQGGGGNISFRMPFVAELNFNCAATVATRKRVGFSLGGGIQYMKYPLSSKPVPVAPSDNAQYLGINAQWWEPVIVTGVKFVGKQFYAREINLRVSMVNKGELDNTNENNAADLEKETIADFKSYAFTLSFLQYINY
ncbi:MAG: hypothetical protein R6U95_02900 [Bacteroidales bacterium]